MNGRIYDPLVGRMLSPDNHIQTPNYTQNYNRYSYALNNPLRFTDPDGELVISDVWILGFGLGFFESSSQRFNHALERANGLARKDFRIWAGLFKTDENKSFIGRYFELVSRFTWQSFQTALGLGISLGTNYIGNVTEVNSRYGVTVLSTKFDDGAFTVGNYIIGPKGLKPDWRDHLFVHEYGHYIQSQRFGTFYFRTIALPSLTDYYVVDALFGASLHETRWYEAGASKLAANYFDKHAGSGKEGYKETSDAFFDKSSFITGRSSLGIIGSLYINPRIRDVNRSTNPTSSAFHWTDLPISYSYGFLPGLIFSILKH